MIRAKRINSILFDHTHLTNGGVPSITYSNDFSSTYSPFWGGGTMILSLDAGKLKAVGSNAWASVFMQPTTIEGHRYKLSFDITFSGTIMSAWTYDHSEPSNHAVGQIDIPASGSYSYEFTAISDNTLMMFANGANAHDFYLDNVKIEDLAPDGTGSYSERLNGSENEKYGLAKSISVMPGDTIKAEVYAKYLYPNALGWSETLAALVGQISAGATGVVVDGAGYGTSTSSFPFAGLLPTDDITGGPKAYLNWLVFDRNYQLITGGFDQIDPGAAEYGQAVMQDSLFSPDIVITQPGYVYIYLSNEEPSGHPVEVYFDDFKVTHTKSPVIQTDDYYPFGLTFNSYTRENSDANQFQYNGKEMQDELNVGWLDYGARMYMPEIGKFLSNDRLSINYMSYSSYGYVANNPINNIDFNGDFILPQRFHSRFKRLAHYLKYDVQGILQNKKIVNALKEYGGFSDSQLKEMFTWGSGPIVTPDKLEPVHYDDGSERQVLGQYWGQKDGIGINIDIVNELENARGVNSEYALFLVAATILHEGVHYGFDLNNMDINKKGEDGTNFERRAYGQVINRATVKPVLDKWLKERNSSSGGIIGYEEGTIMPGSFRPSSDSERKKKVVDHDRKVAERSGGL